MINGIIYAYQNIINGKYYVGCTTEHTCQVRWNNHEKAKSGCLVFNQAMKKYGIDNFVFRILEDNVPTRQELHDLEQYWVEALDSWKHGYNMTSGGEVGKRFNHRPESIEKIRKNSPKIWLGKNIPDSAKRKISEKLTGLVQSEATKQKRSESLARCYAEGRRQPSGGRLILRIDTGELFKNGQELANSLIAEGIIATSSGARSSFSGNKPNPAKYKNIMICSINDPLRGEYYNEHKDTIDNLVELAKHEQTHEIGA